MERLRIFVNPSKSCLVVEIMQKPHIPKIGRKGRIFLLMCKNLLQNNLESL